MIRIHLCASIEGLLLLSNKKLGLLTEMSGSAARKELIQRQLNGEKYISSGDCEGFDPKKGCPGHEVKEVKDGD